MHHERFHLPKTGPTVAEIAITKGKQAAYDLASSPGRSDQILTEVLALASHWSPQEPTDDWCERVAEQFARFPLPVVRACTSADGLANTKVKDARTGEFDIRYWLPKPVEVRQWCNRRMGELTELVVNGKAAARPMASPPLVPEWTPHSPEDCAYVSKRMEQIREEKLRESGRSAEQQRQAAERFLESCRQEGA